MVELTVLFEGALAFVPNVPLFLPSGDSWAKNSSVRSIAVLLPNLCAATPASWYQKAIGASDKPVTRAPHVPLLIFRSGDVIRRHTSREFDLTFTDARTNVKFGVIILLGEAVRFGNQMEPGLDFDGQVDLGSTPPADQEESLWWVPNMAEICPEGALAKKMFDPEAIDFVPPSKTPLGATVYIDRGRITVAGYNMKVPATGEKNVWDFAEVAWDSGVSKYKASDIRKWKKVIGNKLRLKGTLRQSFVTIEFRSEEHGFRTLRLGRCPWSAGKIEMEIANAELETALRMRSSPLHAGESYRRGDADFDGIYNMSAEVNCPRRVPVNEKDTVGDSARPCSPVIHGGFSVK